jgi:hypothetical protein
MLYFEETDNIVNWLRTDDPGENPRWESKCGVIIQIFNNSLGEYFGFYWKDENKKYEKESKLKGNYFTTFQSAKRIIERNYAKNI